VNAPFSILSPERFSDATRDRSYRGSVALLRSRRFATPGAMRLIAMAGLSLTLLCGVLAWWMSARATYEELLPSMVELAKQDRFAAASAAQAIAAGPPPLQGDVAARRNASAPFESLGPAARPFRFAGIALDRARARACLAAAMFYEAGDDGIGQLAVGQVVLNRVRHPAFPGTVCGVVTQGSTRVTGCQFTFTCDGALARAASPAARDRALVHAGLMLDGLVFADVGLATHYHTEAVYPWWSSKLEKIARVGTHLFFRWPGGWGSARVVRPHRQGSEPSAALFASFAGEEALIATPQPHDPSGAQAETPTAFVPMRADEGSVRAVTTSAIPAIPLSRRLVGEPTDEAQGTPVIRSEALGGNRLLRMFPQDNVFHLQLAGSANESARRRIAERLCGGRPECRVYGWHDAMMAPNGPELTPSARRALAFTYVRRAAGDRRAGVSAIGAM
jgi:spore germination cell wall hydrolase CwlJ-like protein